jgi:hypothetical protein
MKKYAHIVTIGLIVSIMNPLKAVNDTLADVQPPHGVSEQVVPAAMMSDEAVFENVSFNSERLFQVSLRAIQAMAELNTLRATRDAVIESQVDVRIKEALIAGFDKKIAQVERATIEQKNNVANERKAIRDKIFIVLGVCGVLIGSYLVGISLAIALNR